MCDETNTHPEGYRLTKTEVRRQRRFEELQTLYNLAAGAYGQTTGVNEELAARVLAELERHILGTPFAGGANNG